MRALHRENRTCQQEASHIGQNRTPRAVSLFLAMADSFNEQPDFLVLDDVVNSFDAAHRGELAALLASDFGHRQLIVLTHDQLSFDRLSRLAPSRMRVEFTSWDFNEVFPTTFT